MIVKPIAIQKTGLVSSVGLNSLASCAAFRTKLTNPSATRFIDTKGDWITAHQVDLEKPWRGLTKLAKMAVLAIDEAMDGIDRAEWARIPLILCVAETDRPGRAEGLDDLLFLQIQKELGVSFAPQSCIVTQGRVAVAVALAQARSLMGKDEIKHVLIAATDSLISWNTLNHYQQQDRLLCESNSNGFIAGEGAGAILVGDIENNIGELVCTGIGFGRETAHIDSGEPLRGDGLTQSINSALNEAGCNMYDINFRITDISGEQYYFKEAALALSRTLRKHKTEFELWHPSECTGNQGATSGASMMALAQIACRKAFGRGPNILMHMSNDAGQRAALSLKFLGSI
jgi:3-oxoacyl-[acyl-carrier-protein] synthase I